MKKLFARSLMLSAALAVLLTSASPAGDEDFNKLAGSIYMRDFKTVKELVRSGINVNMRQDISGSSPLMVACAREGTDEIIEYLLDNGAEVNVKDRKGYTPLMWAAENSMEAVNMLIARGAEVKAVAEDGMTALIKSVFGIISGDITTAVCDTLISHGAEINSALKGGNTGGLTALLFASNKEMPELVEYLIFKGADVNRQADNGRTALMRASLEGDLGTVKILIEAGADPSLKDSEGFTALKIAEEKEKTEVVSYLKSL